MYILHIGTNKTGTSSIQKFLYKNKSELEKLSICYPELGVKNFGHHDLARFMMGAKVTNIKSHDLTELFNLKNKFEKVIISSELFHTHKDPQKLLEFFPRSNTKVILYIREHFSYLRSWYQQAVQLRNITSKFSDFIDLSYTNTLYSNLIERWIKAYGVDNIIVRNYERSALVNNDIVCDFLSQSEIDLPVNIEKDTNLSISGNLLFYKLMSNHFIEEANNYEYEKQIAVLSQLDASFSGKIFVDEDIFRRVVFRYRSDRKNIQEKYGINFTPRHDLGFKSPDFERISQDFRMIIESCELKNFSLAETGFSKILKK